MIDPRSPSSDYNRTPINLNKYNAINQFQNDDSINLNEGNNMDDLCTEALAFSNHKLDSVTNQLDQNIQKGFNFKFSCSFILIKFYH